MDLYERTEQLEQLGYDAEEIAIMTRASVGTVEAYLEDIEEEEEE